MKKTPIESWNGFDWKEPEKSSISNPLPWAGIPPTKPDCSGAWEERLELGFSFPAHLTGAGMSCQAMHKAPAQIRMGGPTGLFKHGHGCNPCQTRCSFISCSV